MNKKQKIMLIRILTAAALLAVLHVLPVTGWMRFGLYLIPYLIAGYDILRKALKGIQNRQVFDENFLMAVATVGAIALALYEITPRPSPSCCSIRSASGSRAMQ